MDARDAGDDWFLIAIITAPFGVRGEVRVELVTEFPARFSRLRTLYLGAEKKPVALQGVHRRGKGGSGLALKLAGYDTAEQAETLRQTHLYIPRTEAVRLPAGRYYVDEIVGLEARLTGGQPLGRVVEVLTMPSNDVYIVDGGTRGEILIPAIRDVVKEINVAEGYLLIEPLPGLLPREPGTADE